MSTIFERVKHLNYLLSQQDRIPTVRIIPRAVQGTVPVTASKFGGVPYLPAGAQAPTNQDGKPLGMVAQINCDDLPQNTVYPQTGVLQFWLDPYDELGLGIDLKNPVSQVNTRVIYYPHHKDTNPCAHALVMPNQEKQTEMEFMAWPVHVDQGWEIGLSFEETSEGITPQNWWVYQSRFVELWNELYPQQPIGDFTGVDAYAPTDEERPSVMFYRDIDQRSYHKLGGHPEFTQQDPRQEHDGFDNYTINLLTMFSEDAEKFVTVWGDQGTANWLITPEQLKNRDFSKVLFEWSCG